MKTFKLLTLAALLGVATTAFAHDRGYGRFGASRSTYCAEHPYDHRYCSDRRFEQRDRDWRAHHPQWDDDRWEREHGRRSWNFDAHHDRDDQ